MKGASSNYPKSHSIIGQLSLSTSVCLCFVREARDPIAALNNITLQSCYLAKILRNLCSEQLGNAMPHQATKKTPLPTSPRRRRGCPAAKTRAGS
eukprot:496648-Prorocentrum_minimum.AAC.3